MRISILVAFAIVLGGCTAPPATYPSTRSPSVEPLNDAQLAMAIESGASAANDCAESTIRTSFGIFLMHIGQADDERIHVTLTGRMEGAALAQREAEYRTWIGSHDAYAVGNQHLRWCLEPSVMVPSARIADCLREAEPSVVMASTRSSKGTPLEAMVRVKKLYPGRFTVPELQALADRVYAGKTFPDDLSLQVEIFAQCLREDSAT